MALHLVKANALFLHIPKTGGSWVEDVLTHLGIETQGVRTLPGATLRHPLVCQIEQRFDFSFAFVRHPVTWYKSWWKYQTPQWLPHEPGNWHPQRVLDRCGHDDFAQFIRQVLEREPGYLTRLYEWYIGPPDWMHVKFVCHYESLAEDLATVLRYLRYPFDEQALRRFPPVNVSEIRRAKPVWDRELLKRLLEAEAPTIRRFYAAEALSLLAPAA